MERWEVLRERTETFSNWGLKKGVLNEDEVKFSIAPREMDNRFKNARAVPASFQSQTVAALSQ